jgi:hypothetical protein
MKLSVSDIYLAVFHHGLVPRRELIPDEILPLVDAYTQAEAALEMAREDLESMLTELDPKASSVPYSPYKVEFGWE